MGRGSHNINRREYLLNARYYARRGEDLSHSKLTEEIVKKIRLEAGSVTAKSQAEKYGVHVRTIEKVRYFLSWVHV